MMNPMKTLNRKFSPHRQQGVVLFIALIVLVAMTLAGIAMVRQMSTGMAVAGNLAFKQNATAAADLGIEAARTWWRGQTASALAVDSITPGYFSSWDATFDPATYNWDAANNASATISDGASNNVKYVIHRLCSTANITVTAAGQKCVTTTVEGSTSTKIGLDASTQPLSNTLQPYYRFTARAQGPRNTLSYVQVVMY